MPVEVTLQGVVGRDAEIKFLDSGVAVASFPLAIDEYKREKDQWVKTGTAWYKINVWGDDAEPVTEAVVKGDHVIVVGTLKVSTYERDGETKATADVKAKTVGVIPRKKKAKKEEEPW